MVQTTVSVPTSVGIPFFPLWIVFSAGGHHVVDIRACRPSEPDPKKQISAIPSSDGQHAFHFKSARRIRQPSLTLPHTIAAARGPAHGHLPLLVASAGPCVRVAGTGRPVRPASARAAAR